MDLLINTLEVFMIPGLPLLTCYDKDGNHITFQRIYGHKFAFCHTNGLWYYDLKGDRFDVVRRGQSFKERQTNPGTSIDWTSRRLSCP